MIEPANWPFILGGMKNDRSKSSMKAKEKSLELAKRNIEKNFYFIGILEEFMDSLKMFELVLPRIYTR